MKGVSWGLIIGVTVGVVIGILLAAAALFCNWLRKQGPQIGNSSSRRASTVPIRTNGVDASSILSDSTTGQESPGAEENSISLWIEGSRGERVISVSGIPKYSLKDLQKATCNFTTLLGQGAFGSVYKAQMSTGETVAVKVLATASKQLEREFQTEVLLLGRLHHRNLVNLVGYCAEKSKHMLIYVYMPNGSLASHLYNDHQLALSWDLRINIALDVARGLEYLHDGVADFGLSREEMVHRSAPIRGTYGYLDPEYVSSRSFTKKSDVYSFGVLLFELIAGRTPQQGLLEYVELAAINADGRLGWEEIADSRLEGSYEAQQLSEVAALAYKCINRLPRKRPSMRDVVQALSNTVKERNYRKRRKFLVPVTIEEDSADQEQPGPPMKSNPEHLRDESFDSLSDFPDV